MLIGIDIGTTVLKAAAFDPRTGKILAHSSRRLEVETGPDGRREQCPQAVSRRLTQVLGQLRKQLGTRWKGVTGIGLATQGGSTILAKRTTGEALTPMALWNDARAFPRFHAIASRKPPSFWRSFSLREEPGMGLARLEQLKQDSPGLIHEDNIYVGIGEFIYHELAGVWRQDGSNALQIGCYDVRKADLTEKPLKLVGIPASFFAPMRRGHETHTLSEHAAKRFGLPEEIPVAGPYGDQEAGFISCMEVSDSPLQCSLGTAWVGNFIIDHPDSGRSPFQLPIPAPKGGGLLVIQPLLTGNVTWDWALKAFVDPHEKKALAKQEKIFADALLPPAGLIAVPWLNRPNPLAPELLGGASYVGLSPSTSKEDLLRAIAAGMCYELARVFGAAARDKHVDSVVLTGGASKGIQFQQLVAALFAPAPVYHVTEEDWVGARGSLYGLNRKAAFSRCELVSLRRTVDTDSILAGKKRYVQAFGRLYGSVRAGKAYEFVRRK